MQQATITVSVGGQPERRLSAPGEHDLLYWQQQIATGKNGPQNPYVVLWSQRTPQQPIAIPADALQGLADGLLEYQHTVCPGEGTIHSLHDGWRLQVTWPRTGQLHTLLVPYCFQHLLVRDLQLLAAGTRIDDLPGWPLRLAPVQHIQPLATSLLSPR